MTQQLEIDTGILDADAAAAALKTPKGKWPATLATMLDAAEAVLRRDNEPAERATRLARLITFDVSLAIGGRELYFPGAEALRGWVRDHEIYAQFNGRNYEELATRHGLTVRRIEQIVAEQRRARLKDIQGSLFP